MLKFYPNNEKNQKDASLTFWNYIYFDGVLEEYCSDFADDKIHDLVYADSPIPEADGIYTGMLCLSETREEPCLLFFWRDSYGHNHGLIVSIKSQRDLLHAFNAYNAKQHVI